MQSFTTSVLTTGPVADWAMKQITIWSDPNPKYDITRDKPVIEAARDLYKKWFPETKTYPKELQYLHELERKSDAKIEPDPLRPAIDLPEEYRISSYMFGNNLIAPECETAVLKIIQYLNARNKQWIGSARYDAFAQVCNILINILVNLSRVDLKNPDSLREPLNWLGFVEALRTKHSLFNEGWVRESNFFDSSNTTMTQLLAQISTFLAEIHVVVKIVQSQKSVGDNLATLTEHIKNLVNKAFRSVPFIIMAQKVPESLSVVSLTYSELPQLAGYDISDQKITVAHQILARTAQLVAKSTRPSDYSIHTLSANSKDQKSNKISSGQIVPANSSNTALTPKAPDVNLSDPIVFVHDAKAGGWQISGVTLVPLSASAPPLSPIQALEKDIAIHNVFRNPQSINHLAQVFACIIGLAHLFEETERGKLLSGMGGNALLLWRLGPWISELIKMVESLANGLEHGLSLLLHTAENEFKRLSAKKSGEHSSTEKEWLKNYTYFKDQIDFHTISQQAVNAGNVNIQALSPLQKYGLVQLVKQDCRAVKDVHDQWRTAPELVLRRMAHECTLFMSGIHNKALKITNLGIGYDYKSGDVSDKHVAMLPNFVDDMLINLGLPAVTTKTQAALPLSSVTLTDEKRQLITPLNTRTVPQAYAQSNQPRLPAQPLISPPPNPLLENKIQDSKSTIQTADITALQTLYCHGQSKTKTHKEIKIDDTTFLSIIRILKHHPHTTCIELQKNRLGAASANILFSVLVMNPIIQKVNLWSNRLGDDGMRPIAALLPDCALKELSLNNNGITAVGAKTLAPALMRSTTLTYLDLGYNYDLRLGDTGLGDAGVMALTQVLQNRATPLDIRLGGNAITEAGAEVILDWVQKNTFIIGIDLDNNNIKLTTLEAIKVAVEKNAKSYKDAQAILAANVAVTSANVKKVEPVQDLLQTAVKDTSPETIRQFLQNNRDSKAHTDKTRMLFTAIDKATIDCHSLVRMFNNQLEKALTAKSTVAFQPLSLDDLILHLQSDPMNEEHVLKLLETKTILFSLSQQLDKTCELQATKQHYAQFASVNKSNASATTFFSAAAPVSAGVSPQILASPPVKNVMHYEAF